MFDWRVFFFRAMAISNIHLLDTTFVGVIGSHDRTKHIQNKRVMNYLLQRHLSLRDTFHGGNSASPKTSHSFPCHTTSSMQ